MLNIVVPRFARQRAEGLRLLHDVVLVHEHRGLRAPRRYAAAAYLQEIFDLAFLAGRPDPPLFDLMLGALRLLERCPVATLPTVVAGVELRFLAALGVLPGLGSCSACGRGGRLWVEPAGAGLTCASHRSPAARPASPPALAWLQRLEPTPGRQWPELPPPPPSATALLGAWITAALERGPRWRRVALA